MKKMVSSLIALTGLVVSLGAFAAITPATTPQPTTTTHQVVTTNPAANQSVVRIGIVDMRQVMEKSAQIAKIRQTLRKEFEPRQQKLLTAQNTLKEDAARLRRDNAIMNNNDRKQLEQKILTEQNDLQKQQATFQQDLMSAQNKALKGFLNNVKVVVEKIARTENLSLVITKDTVAYANANLDITNKVTQQLPQ